MKTIDVIIPVYNEEEGLKPGITGLWKYLQVQFPYKWRIVIADNGSTDSTLEIARELSNKHEGVTYIHLDQKGRGRALRKAFLESPADIVSYMDVDLSTDLNAFTPLIKAIVEDGYDISSGSRLIKGAKVKRCLKREITSRCYNLLVRMLFFTSFKDAQCGFKAIKKEVAIKLVPLVQNQGWFLDTELLILAEKKGYRIKEIPVTWVEDPGSTVNVWKTAVEDIKGLLRLRFRPTPE